MEIAPMEAMAAGMVIIKNNNKLFSINFGGHGHFKKFKDRKDFWSVVLGLYLAKYNITYYFV